MTGEITRQRNEFHQALISTGVLSISSDNVASNADSSQKSSKLIAASIAHKLGAVPSSFNKMPGQRVGKSFESLVASFLENTFPLLSSVRPGKWSVENLGSSRGTYQMADYEPYSHLAALAAAVKNDPTLSVVLGNSYSIGPDVVVLRNPETDSQINADRDLVDDESGLLSAIREKFHERPIAHAVVSCKWTLRSDRAQNARSEALSLIRNRKGRTPHITVVTAEPAPSRLASLALGTGDIDAVYHFALPELIDGVADTRNDEAIEMLRVLVDGKRLKDISDLPLDLAI